MGRLTLTEKPHLIGLNFNPSLLVEPAGCFDFDIAKYSIERRLSELIKTRSGLDN